MGTTPTIAFISEGRLMLLPAGSAEPREVVSQYVQTVLDRTERDRQRTSWKDDSFGWNVTRGGMNAAAMGFQAPEGRRIRFTAAACSSPGEVMYTIETDAAGGLFRQEVASGDELRVFHKQQTRVVDVASHPKSGVIAMSLRRADGTAHLCLMNPGGGGARELTEGDVVDESPSWSRAETGPRGTLVYHSAGFARNASGFLASKGPYAALKLDLDADEMTTLAESDGFDYLSPRELADGTLLYIRRPYRPRGQPVSTWARLKDILMFPVGVATAVVHYLNFFSLLYSKKPLITASGPRREGPDEKDYLLWGMHMGANRALREEVDGGLVPKDWVLMRRGPDRAETELAKGVVAFDVGADGTVVWTNGASIKVRDGTEDGILCEGKRVERLVVVG